MLNLTRYRNPAGMEMMCVDPEMILPGVILILVDIMRWMLMVQFFLDRTRLSEMSEGQFVKITYSTKAEFQLSLEVSRF